VLEIGGLTFSQENNSDQVGYDYLFKKDYMDFPNRQKHDANEQFFEIATNTGTWAACQQKSIEQVIYHSNDSKRVVTKIEFEGWRRYVEERRPTEGGRIIFHVQNLQKQSLLARIIDDNSFREIGWMEPIVAITTDPILGINFRETAVENNPDYIDDLFRRIRQVEALPNEILLDLKNVIALNSIDRFKERMIKSGFSEYEYEEALKSIRPSALKGVASPFYVAALFCRDNQKFKEARKLLKKIPKTHWQYEESRNLERSLYEQEIRQSKQKYEQIIDELKNEVAHLKSRGSISNRPVVKDDEAKLPATTIKSNPQIVTSLAKEMVPYFQGLLSTRQETPEATPKTRLKPRVSA
jgi:hypothetical protein